MGKKDRGNTSVSLMRILSRGMMWIDLRVAMFTFETTYHCEPCPVLQPAEVTDMSWVITQPETTPSGIAFGARCLTPIWPKTLVCCRFRIGNHRDRHGRVPRILSKIRVSQCASRLLLSSTLDCIQLPSYVEMTLLRSSRDRAFTASAPHVEQLLCSKHKLFLENW